MVHRPSLEATDPAVLGQGSFLSFFPLIHMLPGGLTCHEHLSVSSPTSRATVPMVPFLDTVFPILSFCHLVPFLCPVP